MQKRNLSYLSIVVAGIFCFSYAQAALHFLPRYQGSYGARSQEGGRDGVCSSSYQYTCSGTGYSGGKGTSCSGKYKSCNCETNYKWSGGKCVLKGCSDYGYLASKDTTKSCTEKTPRTGLTCYSCTGCDTSVYKYSCSGGINATTQSGTACNSLYDKCACVDNATWNATSGKCECNTDYKVSDTSCVLKTCSDYGYLASADSTKSCTSKTPRTGLTCYSCTDCDSSYKYDCSSIMNASGGDGSSCGGKYQKCKCNSLYSWNNGSCVLNCTRNSCSSTKYPLTATNVSNAASYETCTPSCSDESNRYRVASCNSGYTVNSSGTGCETVPTKTCEDILMEKGYTIVKTDYDFYKYTEYGREEKYEPLVIMNDIETGVSFDNNGNKMTEGCENVVHGDILTPEYFHSEYPQCSGTPKIMAKNYIWFNANNINSEINIYPDIYLSNNEHNYGWLYVDYIGSIDKGKVIFHGDINAQSSHMGISSYEPIITEFKGNIVESQSMSLWQVVLGSRTKFNINETDNYQVQSLTMENGASISAKIQNNGKYFWYTITANDKTMYKSEDAFYWIGNLPNNCSSSGSVNIDYQNTKGICTGRLSYMCETASGANSMHDGSEKETDLDYCRGKTIGCGTESCVSVVSKKGYYVTDGNNFPLVNSTKPIYLAKSVIVSGDVKLGNYGIYSAAEEFEECMCDSSVEKNPKLTITGKLDVIENTAPISINVEAEIGQSDGEIYLHKDTTIKEINANFVWISGSYSRFWLQSPMTLKVNKLYAVFPDNSTGRYLQFLYAAENTNVIIDEAVCGNYEECSGFGQICMAEECNIDVEYEIGSGISKGGTFKYCPISWGEVNSRDMALTYLKINGYNADEISGKSYYQYPQDFYPSATVSCSY